MVDKTLTFYRIASYVLVHLFLLTLFQPITICLFWVSLLTIKTYLCRAIAKLIEKGLIVYLPSKTQHILRERSLFDLMCDFWFIQNASIVKVLLKPFFVQIQPDRAAEVLDELNPGMKQKMLTKGIINILPDSIKTILSPDNPNEQEQLSRNRLNDVQLRPMCYDVQQEQLGMKNSLRQSSIHIQSPKRREIAVRRVKLDDMHFNDNESISEPSSDHTVVLPKQRIKNTHQWDKLSFYRNFRNRANSKDNIFSTIKNNISALKNLLELKKVTVQRVSYRTLAKLFVVCMIALVVQVKLHPRSRSIIIQTIQILLCVVSVGGAFGMGGLIAYKNYITNKERKEFIKKIKQN